MPAINLPRRKPDPVAVATKGKATSQIQTQESSDKSRVTEADEDIPRTNETDEDVPRITSTYRE